MTGAGVVSHDGEVISGANQAIIRGHGHGGVGHGWEGYTVDL